MIKKSHEYVKGDWIVHMVYGIGQIKAVETKSIAGEARDYFRVQVDDGDYWVPVDDANNERVRPLTSKRMITRAKKIFKEAPEELETDHKKRRQQIISDILDGSILSDVRLIRDLSALKYIKGLNKNDQDSLERVKSRFLREWELSSGMDVEKINQKMDQLLKENQELIELPS